MRGNTRIHLWAPALGLALCVGLTAWPASAQDGSRLDNVLDRVIANEHRLASTLEQYQPLMETYIQTVEPDSVLGQVPIKDNYFFGRFEIPKEIVTEGKRGRKVKREKKNAVELFDDFHSQIFKPEAFARTLIVDRERFSRDNYQFDFIRAEFLGEVRTLVFDLTPRRGRSVGKTKTGRFAGRIWVEDQDYNIVRFNGRYSSELTVNFHFDSWRLNMSPNLWLPAYVYTEEPDRTHRQMKLTHKGQTRLWGYEVPTANADDEFTKVMIDSAETKDSADQPGMISPVESARAWEAEAEDNVIQRLERSGLLAPDGDVDQVLETVVTNLEVTNELNIQPPIRCRVLLTTPLESFTVGHTIVVSRGLIDVLPDEASLAMVLAHEMGHILAGHELDTKFAFSNQVLVPDTQAMEQFVFERDPLEEAQADQRALDLLDNSPYKGDLETAGLFLRALSERSEDLRWLIQPHFGGRLASEDQKSRFRMEPILQAAPALDPGSVEQIAALPLGSRVRMDPWSARVHLMKNNRVPLLSPSEKMAFQVTPLMPYLARFGSGDSMANNETTSADSEIVRRRRRHGSAGIQLTRSRGKENTR